MYFDDSNQDPRLSETLPAQTTPEHGNSPVDQDASSALCMPTPPSFIPAPKCEDVAAAVEQLELVV